MGTNLWALPTWIFGTYLTCGLAIYGAVKLWRTHRAFCGLLIALVAVFPVGYLAWWASSLTTNGALLGTRPALLPAGPRPPRRARRTRAR